MKEAPLPDQHKATTYQLGEDTVSPTRYIDRDDDGNAIEETISCYPLREMFVDKAGNVCDVVLCNSRTTSRNNEAIMYARNVRLDWLRAGGLPLKQCPYAQSLEYKELFGSATLVKVPKGASACDGKPDGCEHMHAVIKQRRDKRAADHAKQEATNASLNGSQLEAIAKTFGAELARGMTANKADLVNVRSEKD
jgi:hypothetical protein